jgi:putative DNA primase/helicase
VISHGILKPGQTITGTDGVTYAFTGDSLQADGQTFSSFVVHKPRKAPHQQHRKAARAGAPAGSPPPADAPLPKAPYRVLGWSTSLDAIWVQTSEAGIVGSVPLSKAGLQRIAPIGYWENLAPGRFGPDWDGAISKVRDAAEALGAFTPDRIRGCGVWLDNDRVIWHLGNRIEVDGHQLHLTELQDTAYTYAALPPLDINPEVPQLTDAEGTAILELFTKRMRWGNDGDGLLVAGHTVLGNVCAALDYRPGLQLTGGSGDGKSTTQNKSIAPLQAGLALRTSGGTEAGIRQTMKMDALPVVIDESEQENARQREGHLHLLRLSFDGQQQVKGTPGGKSLTYTMRSMITLIGINAAVPNTADRNRLVVVRPCKLQPEAWRQFQLQRDKLITIEAGQRLIRRTVSNLPALLANIKTFTAVLASQKGTDRTHQVIGSLLAGAHHLTSTAVLDADAALTWLDAVSWSGIDEDALEATSADAEARACLDHLLAWSVRWNVSQTGTIAVLELLQIAQGLSIKMGETNASELDKAEAVKALGRLGIKFDRERQLVVANSCKVYAGSKWANGNHRDHLLSLDKAQAVTSAVWFPGIGSKKAVSLPLPAATA